MFLEQLKNTLNEDYNESMTENGALGYETQGSKLVDLNFKVSSMRFMDEAQIIESFMDAYVEDPMLAIKWLFYLGDIREGLGERRSFNIILNYLALEYEEIVLKVLDLIPEYSRWDYLIALIDCKNEKISKSVFKIIQDQLFIDVYNCENGDSISLLAKWLPSENASSIKSKQRAKLIAKKLGVKFKIYRKILVKLRKHLDVTECKMSAKQWSDIDYSTVPSKANVKYNSAFLKNDKDRRVEYLESLKKSETKINAGALFPHDIVHKYVNDNSCSWYCRCKDYNETLEQLWKNLKDVGNINNTMVVADGSGSMSCRIDNKSSTTALDVANALAIYCGERCTGEFKDKYITFSMRPQLVDFSNAQSLKEKIEIAFRYNEVANTNIEAVFDLILKTATDNNMSQDEIPQNVLIISDMEFDCCARYRNGKDVSIKLFKEIESRYIEAGYKLPRLIFWNVNSRTNTIPVRENDLGVALVSGFSINTMNMVMSNELDPYKCLVKELNKERYQVIELFLKDYFNK